jgi:N-acetylmuramoyl-L-alanine amidase
MRLPFRSWLSLALFVCVAFPVTLAPGVAAAQPLIVVDAGHGGTDPGAVGCSIEEAAVVLDVALRLRTELEGAGLRVALTRDVDEFVGLSARATFANSMSADGFVSIHSNANAGTPATGTETWIANAAGDRSLSLATLLQDEMVMTWGLRDRGVKRADFVVVRDTTMPAALTELAFTNNCTTDATLLGSPDRRQAMAEAQARAILAWLGIEPGMTGTLRGVVFEDQGVGTMDLSVRLPGAAVRIVETGATTTADAAEAAWLFDLPPGTYTVEASAPGHTTASRSCDVTSGGTTWCSIGLFPSTTPMPDAAVPAPDDAAVVSDPDASATIAPDAAQAVEADAGTVMRPNAGDCSCRASSRRGPSAWALIVGAVLLLGASRRRARTLGILALAVLGLGAAACARDGAGHAPLPLEQAHDEAARTIVAGEVVEGAAVRLLGERELLLSSPDGRVLGTPFVSPDARSLALAPSDASALYVWRSESDALTAICASRHCGHEPRFFGDGLLAVRTPEQSSSAIPGDAFTLAGQPSATRLGARTATGALGLAWVEDETVVRVRVGEETRTLAQGEERFIRAELSPDARHVVVEGLTSGLTVHRLADGARFALGRAGHAHFDPEGRVLVFDRTTDDGHALVTADAFLAELGPSVVVRPLATSERLETSPTISRIAADGTATVALARDGAVVVATLSLR